MTDTTASGALPENILHFARALRDAGLPVGPGAVLDAVAAIEAIGFGRKQDFRAALHAVFVKKHEHSLIFDSVFDIYWKRKGFLEKLIAMMSPQAKPDAARKKAEAGATRVADALFKNAPRQDNPPKPELDLDARLTMSAAEILQTRDFAQMTAGEIALARRLIDKLVMPDDRLATRRYAPHRLGRRVDPRRSFRGSLSGIIDLEFRSPVH